MKKVIFIITSILFVSSGFAQQCKSILTGTVIDYHDKTPLVGATVQSLDGSIVVKSNDNGNFKVKGLCDITYTFEISHPECSTTLLNVEINGDTNIDIKLEHHLEELEEVKVIGSSVKQTNSAQEISLDTETIELYSSATLGDALNEIAGVSSLNTGANIVKPVIHGLNGSRVLMLNNGVRMQDMEWGDEHAPNIDLNSAGSVSVIKGASALQYGGDAIGGVIVLGQARFPKIDSLYGKTILNGVSNGRGGSLSSELIRTYKNGLFLKGQASYKRLGDREAPDYVLSNTGIQEIGASIALGKNLLEWGWNFNYSYYNAELAILRSSHIGNIDDLIRSINSGEPLFIRPYTYNIQNPRQKVEHHLAKIGFYKRFEGLGRLNVQYDFQSNNRFEFDVRRGESDDRQSLDLELTTHTLSTDFKWDANKTFEVRAGLMFRYQNNFADPATGIRRLIPDYDKYDLGSFITSEFKINDVVTLDAGLRYDFSKINAKKFYQTSRWEERGYDIDFQNLVIEDLGNQLLVNPVFDYHNFSGAVGVQYRKNNFSILRANYSLSQRAPNPAELFSDGLHQSAARIELGDLRLNSETSHKFSLSKEREYTRWGYTIEPYVNFVSDFMLLEPTGVEFTIRGAFPVWSYRQTQARLLGADLNIYTQFFENWKTNHSFSIVKGKDMTNDTALINIPSANIKNSLSFTKPEWKKLELRLTSDYVFRQNEVPDNFTVFSPEQQEEILLEINTAPKAYHLLGLYSKVAFNVGNGNTLTTSLAVNNLLDTRFRNYLNRQRFFADDLGRNIILQLKFNY
ncbi:TonB-dependent receptor [uncultured Croceitalea sp.]|uniref:TonB-dependent receptor n=1 Tax=uncultured Croceitalea sp. TaxID=1798908 RepID=UPI00374F0241